MKGMKRKDFLLQSAGAGISVSLLNLLEAGGAGGSIAEAAGSSSLARADASVTIWKAPHSPNDASFMKAQLATFEKANPSIKTTYTVTPWATWTETYTAAYKGNNPPDIAYMPNSFFPQFSDAGVLTPLNKQSFFNTSQWRSLFSPSVWGEMVRNGNLYGIPWLQDNVVFVWNKAHFRKAGLDPNKKPKTWADLRRYAQLLTKQTNGKTTQWGYGIMDNTQNFMLNFVPIPMVNYGGALDSPDDKKWLGNSPGHVQGLQIQCDMMQKDKTAPPFGTFHGSDLNAAFLEGKVSMYLSYSDFLVPLLPNYPGFELGVSSPPSGPLNNNTIGGVGGWFMASKAQNKAAAWAVMQFLASRPVSGQYTKMVKFFPARNDANPYQGDPLMSAFARAQGTLTRLPLLPFDYWSICMPQCEQALLGQISAKQALDNAASAINTRIQSQS